MGLPPFVRSVFGQKKRPSSKTKGGAGVDLRCQMRFLKQIMRFAS